MGSGSQNMTAPSVRGRRTHQHGIRVPQKIATLIRLRSGLPTHTLLFAARSGARKHVRGAHAPLMLSWDGVIGERLLHPRHTSSAALVSRRPRSFSILAILTEPSQKSVGFCGVVREIIFVGIRRLRARFGALV
jgi:hypothetical protein